MSRNQLDERTSERNVGWLAAVLLSVPAVRAIGRGGYAFRNKEKQKQKKKLVDKLASSSGSTCVHWERTVSEREWQKTRGRTRRNNNTQTNP